MRLAPGESVQKVFPIVKRRKAMGWIEGQLAVTDARVLYRAKAKTWFSESSNFREIQVADVNGLGMVVRRGFTPVGLLSLVVGFFVGWWLVSVISPLLSLLLWRAIGTAGVNALGVLLYLLVIVLTIVLAVVRFKSTALVLVVTARGVDISPVTVVGMFGDRGDGVLGAILTAIASPLLALLVALGFFDASDATTTSDLVASEAIYHELGTLILELQAGGAREGV